MRYRTIGSTGAKASILGFGCMRLPTLGSNDRIDEDAAAALLHHAIDHGVNYVDTAWFYHGSGMGQPGQSEPFVGRALAGGWRDRVNLVTKLPASLTHERADMDRFLHQQLERLQTDHLDFYLVHGINGAVWDRMRDLGVIEFLEGAKAEGLIRFPAFSFHGPAADFPRIIDEYDGWAFGQVQYNYADTTYQAGHAGLRYAADKGIGVVVMEPLKGGRLAHGIPPRMQAVFEARPEGWSPAEWALRYVWNEPGVSLLLSGMTTPEQLTENLRVADTAEASTLSADELAVYDEALVALRTGLKADCTACRYCQPCPEGVRIPEVLAALNASAMWSTSDRFATGWSAVAGDPALCTECGQCEEICPQELPIRDLLKETARTFAG